MSKTFALAFRNLPGNIQQNVKDEIMKSCGWNNSQYFSMKKNGTRLLTEKRTGSSEFIMRKYGFDAWTGESGKLTMNAIQLSNTEDRVLTMRCLGMTRKGDSKRAMQVWTHNQNTLPEHHEQNELQRWDRTIAVVRGEKNGDWHQEIAFGNVHASPAFDCRDRKPRHAKNKNHENSHKNRTCTKSPRQGKEVWLWILKQSSRNDRKGNKQIIASQSGHYWRPCTCKVWRTDHRGLKQPRSYLGSIPTQSDLTWSTGVIKAEPRATDRSPFKFRLSTILKLKKEDLKYDWYAEYVKNENDLELIKEAKDHHTCGGMFWNLKDQAETPEGKRYCIRSECTCTIVKNLLLECYDTLRNHKRQM